MFIGMKDHWPRRTHFGGYYSKDLKKVEEPKPVEAAVEEPKGEPPHNAGPEHVCPECKDWHTKHADLKTNYDALLNDLKEERKLHYEQGNYKWVARLDQKIQDLEKAITEKFPTEKQSAQLDYYDPMGHGLGDLYILPNSPEEADKIKEFLKSKNKDFKWSRANVEGHKWYGKSFIEVMGGMYLEPEMREYFAGTPLHTRPVEEIMAKKEAGAQNATELTVVDHSIPRPNKTMDEGGKDGFDEFQDEVAMPAGTEKESAKGIPGSLFNAETAPAVVEQLKSGIKAPYVNAQVASLGGPENVSVIFTVSADPKESWANGILDNSRYGKFYLHNDGDVEQFSGAFAGWKQPNRAVRSRNVKSIDQLIQVINNHIAQVQATPKAASLKIASIPITVFNKQWSATPVTKEGKLGYDISDESGKKVLHLAPLNGKEMNAEHLKWAAERELQKGYKKGTLKETLAFLKAGSKVLIIASDKAKGKVKFASLEHGVRGWCKESSIQIEALESQAVSHNGHSDKVLGQTGSETLLDCVEGGPIWVNSTELLDANRPPATPESLNEQPIEEEAAKKEVFKKELAPRPCIHCGKKFFYYPELQTTESATKCQDCYGRENEKWQTEEKKRKDYEKSNKHPKNIEPSFSRIDIDDPMNEVHREYNPFKKSSKDCPDCHGEFAGKENEKEALRTQLPPLLPDERAHVNAAKGDHREWAVRLDGHKIVSTHATEEEAKKALDAIPSHYFVSGEVVYRDVSENEKKALRTQLPPLLPDERAHVNASTDFSGDIECEKCKTKWGPTEALKKGKCEICGTPFEKNASTEKKADEVLSAEGLDMYANNTSELYQGKMSCINLIKEMIHNNTYDRNEARGWWYNWFVAAARRYLKEFPEDAQPNEQTIADAAFEIEPYELEKIKRGEYDKPTTNEPTKNVDLNKLPVIDLEKAKSDIIDQLQTETDPEKKKSLERRYKHLTMASLRKQSKADDTCRRCKKEHVPTYLGVCDSCNDDMYKRDYSDKESALEKDAIIVHQDGKWCVKSPKNPKWNGGCYPSREKAEQRLKTVEMFKHMKGTKVRPFSKKAESLTDPYAALTQQISDMRTRMEQVQQRLEANPLPKVAGKDETDSSELSVEEVFEDVAMGLDLLESKLKDEPESEELHKSLEELENLLWETEMKAGITPELSEHEKGEEEHTEVVKEIEEKEIESSEKGKKPSSLVHKEETDELEKKDQEEEPVEKEAQAPVSNPAMGTPVAPAQNVQPTDDDNLEVPTVKPTSPPAPGQVWVWDAANKTYVSMPDPNAKPGATI